MPKIFAPRISDPSKFVEVVFENRGSTCPGYDENNNPFPAFTSYFEVNGNPLYTQIDERKLITVHAGATRLKHDSDALANYAVNWAAVDWTAFPNLPYVHPNGKW